MEVEKWKSGKTHSVSFINEREPGLICDYPNSNEGIPLLKYVALSVRMVDAVKI